jgi:hypothetical protein
MKNIHILPTSQLSRLKQNKITKKYSLVTKGIDLTSYTPVNIYITSDEEIKDECWIIPIDGVLYKLVGLDRILESDRKIILTTDQDLIKDGVQAIDDNFLEWFVKNPSCEKVEIFYEFPQPSKYKIIIPSKESKQETLEEIEWQDVRISTAIKLAKMIEDKQDEID